MKCYICDICGRIMAKEEPFKLNMREFYIGFEIDEYGLYPTNTKRRAKTHICGDCFLQFKKLVEKKGETK